MSRPTPRPVRVAACLLLGVMVSVTAACGSATAGSTPGASPSVHKAVFDQRLHDLLPQSVRDQGFIQVGTDASYAPMSSFAPDGRTIIGMEPDLGLEIGRVLGVRLRFDNVDFSELLADVGRGNPDLGMSAMTDTAERAKSADFVNYFTAGTSIVVQRGNPAGVTELNDLCGKVVAVEKGTTQVDLLARTQKNCGNQRITVKTYTTNSDALVQLRTGRAAAVLNDLPPAVFLVNDVATKSQYQLASTAQYEPGVYGIIVAKSQPGLRDAVKGALEQLMRSRVYADVLTRWHVSDGAVQQVTINSER
jgi:polar amino acid transport system substrate-binding protein